MIPLKKDLVSTVKCKEAVFWSQLKIPFVQNFFWKLEVREGFDIDEQVKLKEDCSSDMQHLRSYAQRLLGHENSLMFDEKLKEVSDNIVGYIANKAMKYCNGCCQEQLINQVNSS